MVVRHGSCKGREIFALIGQTLKQAQLVADPDLSWPIDGAVDAHVVAVVTDEGAQDLGIVLKSVLRDDGETAAAARLRDGQFEIADRKPPAHPFRFGEGALDGRQIHQDVRAKAPRIGRTRGMQMLKPIQGGGREQMDREPFRSAAIRFCRTPRSRKDELPQGSRETRRPLHPPRRPGREPTCPRGQKSQGARPERAFLLSWEPAPTSEGRVGPPHRCLRRACRRACRLRLPRNRPRSHPAFDPRTSSPDSARVRSHAMGRSSALHSLRMVAWQLGCSSLLWAARFA